MSNQETQQANGRYSYSGKIVVDSCPYCEKTHYHSLGYEDSFVRLAHCLIGEYKIVFEQNSVTKD